MLLLEQDVRFVIGSYGFTADRATVRIDIEQRPGLQVHHVMLYLDNARGLRGQGAVTADAKRLLVTVSTAGRVRLSADTHEHRERTDLPFVNEARRRFGDYLAMMESPLLPVPPGDPLYEPPPRARR